VNLAELKKMIESGHDFYKEHREELKPALKKAARFLDMLSEEKDSAARTMLLQAIEQAEGREKELLEIAELDGAISDVRDEREGGTTLEKLADGVSGVGLIVKVLAQAAAVIA